MLSSPEYHKTVTGTVSDFVAMKEILAMANYDQIHKQNQLKYHIIEY